MPTRAAADEPGRPGAEQKADSKGATVYLFCDVSKRCTLQSWKIDQRLLGALGTGDSLLDVSGSASEMIRCSRQWGSGQLGDC